MSISNAVTKEEFDLNQVTTESETLGKAKRTVTKKTEAKEEAEVTSKSLDATQLYLGEIGFSPLLTAEEEVLYARRAEWRKRYPPLQAASPCGSIHFCCL